MTLPVTALTAIICGALLLILAISTATKRMKAGIAFGMQDDNPPLTSASRSHGNLSEHAPLFILMLALLELSNAHHIGLMVLASFFLLSRIAHIIGLHSVHQVGKPPAPRALGVVGTWISYALAIAWIAYMIVTVNL